MNSPQKRPHSPDHSSRRVRQRVEKRAETPEEGEVEEAAPVQTEVSERETATEPVADGSVGPNESKPLPPARSKVAFPFNNNRAKKVQSIPKVDLVNAAPPPKRRTPSPPHSIAASHHSGDRGSRNDDIPPPGRNPSYDNRPRRDSYVPGRDRRKDGYPPRRDSPDRYYDRRRSASRSPPYVYRPRPDSYVPRRENDHWRGDSYRPRDSPPREGDFYRKGGSSPPRYRSRTPPWMGRSPERDLPRRPHSPPRGMYRGPGKGMDTYIPSRRFEDDPRNDERGGYQPNLASPHHPLPVRLIDRISAPDFGPEADFSSPRGTPPPPTTAPPPLPVPDSRLNRPPAMHPLPPKPLDPHPPSNSRPLNVPPRQPLPPQFPSAGTRAEPPHPSSLPPPPPIAAAPPVKSTAPPPNERSNEAKPSTHKVANVRSKEDESTAYSREFKGSGRINEYILMQKLGEGTFGEVHQARPRDPAKSGTGDLALKRIIMHSEKEGMPITALREIKILKALNHPNIVKVLDIVVMPRTPKDTGSVYVVFPYMDHDLSGLLENKSVQLSQSHIKLYMKQLLEGVEYMHDNHIIHRDIKAANILVSNEGVLQIADFGLARPYIKNTKMERMNRQSEKYTNCVVTRWYRPPELLMGERYYGPEIDLWGVGCILAEMFLRRPLFQGSSDMDQLEKIWWLCGTPTDDSWPDFRNLPGLEGVKTFNTRPKELRTFLNNQCPSMTDDTFRLIDTLLTPDPSKRPSASTALLHDYFWTSPLPADPKTIPKFEPSHELDRRKKAMHAPPPNPHQQHPNNHGPPFHNGMGRNSLPMRPPHQGLPIPPQMHGRMNGPGPIGNVPPINMHGHPPHLPPLPHMQNANGAPGPPPMGPNGLPPPRGFRGPPRNQHNQHNQHRQQYRHNGPPGGGPRGPPPQQDSMVLRYD
ncbi:serine/threonine protein kinase, CMGC, CDC2/CDK sub [Serendipita sp. 411]|nr:serine/threonine protein kinase, CMGC, CDC2/CDK sub [Serendipita sp. 411]